MFKQLLLFLGLSSSVHLSYARQQDSLDGSSARRKAATCTRNNSNIE
jgi:hypothetical protein